MSHFGIIRRFSTVWSKVKLGPPDAILGITEAYKRDTNTNKVNLGAGAYRNDDGKPFVLPSVRRAESLVLSNNLDKEYAGIEGIPHFRTNAIALSLGKSAPSLKENRVATVQTISGTGALRIAGVFLAKFAPQKEIWVPTPTWGNHLPIFEHSGLAVQKYRYYNAKTCGFDYGNCLTDLERIPHSHVVLLHACAHNPTGVDPTSDEWRAIGEVVKRRQLIPLFDLAYQGFASGDVDADAEAVRYFTNELQLPTVLITQSFAKNMGLYGERVGSLSVVCSDAEEAGRCLSQIKIIIRPMYSNPPIHGARIASTVMSDADLRNQWFGDLKSMANRIISMRNSLVDLLKKEASPYDWSHITKQIGMFCYSGLQAEQVDRLAQEYSVYLTRDGRISIASLSTKNVAYVAHAIHQVTK